MKTLTLNLQIALLAAAALFAGCGKQSTSTGTPESSSPAMPQTQSALSTAGEETKKAVSDAASTIATTAKTTASDIGSKFITMAKAQGDKILSSIGQDLGIKAQALVDSCGANEAVKTNINASLNSLITGKDDQALAPAFQLSQAPSLTGPQLQLAKEVGNLASAFVVQRNFSTVSGVQGDVASLVKSLRNGEYVAALPPLKNIMGNASLTPQQKNLIGSVADKYAPSLKQAAGALQQGLQGLPGFKK